MKAETMSLDCTARRCNPASPGRAFRLARRLAGARDGSASMEFALALPILLLILLGMFEVSMILFINTSVEGGLREAARYGITGQTPASGTREDQIIAILDRYTLGMVDLDSAQISFRTYKSFNDVEQPEPWIDEPPFNGVYDPGETFDDLNGDGKWSEDRGIAGVGNAGDVVLYDIRYDWALLTPFLSGLLGDSGVMHMRASIVVRNEPYGQSGSTP